MSSESTKDDAQDHPQPESVQIHFIKSNGFRVIHCDGAWGGPSPNGRFIHLSLFSERLPLPQQVSHEATPEQRLGPEIGRVTREGFVREIEIDAVMTFETAESLGNWLLKNVQQYRSSNEHSNPEAKGDKRRRRPRRRN